jgi:choline dehydrogenase-like flavoprotein
MFSVPRFPADEPVSIFSVSDSKSTPRDRRSGAGGGTLGNELAQKGIRTLMLEAGPRIEWEQHIDDERKSFAQLTWLDKRTTSGSWQIAKDSPNFPARNTSDPAELREFPVPGGLSELFWTSWEKLQHLREDRSLLNFMGPAQEDKSARLIACAHASIHNALTRHRIQRCLA